MPGFRVKPAPHSTAKSTRWVPYGGEANRDAKNRKAQRARADRPERNGQTEPFARVAKPEPRDRRLRFSTTEIEMEMMNRAIEDAADFGGLYAEAPASA